jgi:hypothetical protein
MKRGTENFKIMRAETYLGSDSKEYYHAPQALFERAEKEGEDFSDCWTQRMIVSAGSADTTMLFSEGDLIYIYTANDALGYMGIEVYDTKSFSNVGDIFLQSDQDYAMYERLTPMNRTKAMREHIS